MNPFYIQKYDVIALIINLTQCGITRKESIVEKLLSRSSEPLSKSGELWWEGMSTVGGTIT